MNFPGKLREYIPAAQLIIIDGNYVQETKFSEDGLSITFITPDKIEYVAEAEQPVLDGKIFAHIPGVSESQETPISVHKLFPVEARRFALHELIAVADYIHVNSIDPVKVKQLPPNENGISMIAIQFPDGPDMLVNASQPVTLIDGECEFFIPSPGAPGAMEMHRMSFFVAFKMTEDLYRRRLKSM